MGRLRVFSGRGLIAFSAGHGFQQIRHRGSHTIIQRRTVSGTITIPVPDHAALRVGTLQASIRQSGLPRSLFERE